MEFLQILKDYGLLAVIVLFIIDKIWPFWRKSYIQQSEARADELRIQRQAELEAIKAENEERTADRLHRQNMEDRLTAAYEQLVKTQEAQSLLLTSLNERMNQIVLLQQTLSNHIMEATANMRETVARLHPEAHIRAGVKEENK